MGSSVFRLKVSIFRNLCWERRYTTNGLAKELHILGRTLKSFVVCLPVKQLSEYIHFQEAAAVENGVVPGKKLKQEGEVVVDHCNIIERCFWEEHPHILSYS